RLAYMLQRMIEVSVLSSVCIVLFVVVGARPILDFLGGSAYADAAPVLRIQAVALIPVFVSQVFVVGLVAIRRQREQAFATGLALVLVLALGGSLIPSYGARGAAVSAVIAELALALSLLYLVARADPHLRPSFTFVWKVAAASIPAVAAAFVPGVPTL